MEAPRELRQEQTLTMEESFECAYCGSQFTTRESAAEHIPNCRKHPAAKYVQVYDRLILEIEAILKAAPVKEHATKMMIRQKIGDANERLGRPRC